MMMPSIVRRLSKVASVLNELDVGEKRFGVPVKRVAV
jgi:hypothetical protein